jgi:hypothetical protein
MHLHIYPMQLLYIDIPTFYLDNRLADLEKRMTTVLALLEVALPLYWNTSTRHYLLHVADSIRRLGHFWAISMLGVERLHVLIKTLSKGRKNVMKSFQNQYELFFTSQVEWRQDKQHVWSSRGRGSSLAEKMPVPAPDKVIELKGRQRRRKADPQLFQQLQDQWAILNKGFDSFRDKWRRHNSRSSRANQGNFILSYCNCVLLLCRCY